MFDSHCHLQFKAYDEDQNEVIARILESKTKCIIVGTQKDTSAAAAELAKKYPNQFYASVGLHPTHLHSRHVDEKEGAFKSREEDFDFDFYKKLAQDPTVVAIGETGLDYFRMPDHVSEQEIKQKQKEVFLQHIDLAEEVNKPMVIHCRDAYDDLAELWKERNPKIKATVHCFTGNELEVEKLVSLGLYVGFTGIITFPPRKDDPEAQERLLEAVKRVPLEQLLVETDAPYLAPGIHRGKRCEPWMASEVAEKIAELKKIQKLDIINTTSSNAKKLFQIK